LKRNNFPQPEVYFPKEFTRALRRETFRDAVFLCTMPFCAARITNGSATRKAFAAAC
jgi:hypothetical protein